MTVHEFDTQDPDRLAPGSAALAGRLPLHSDEQALEAQLATQDVRMRSQNRLARKAARDAELALCAHCGRPQDGSASVSRGGRTFLLCHPDRGLDCYHLVTVYNEVIGSRRGTL